jgi:hypothetical protein
MGRMDLVGGIASLAAFVILVSLLSRYRLGRLPTLAFTFLPSTLERECRSET